MTSPSLSSTQGSDLSTNPPSSNRESSSLTFTSYRNMSASQILTEIKEFENNGIYYLANDNIASSCNFTYNKSTKGEILVPKENSNDITEMTFSGVFEVDARNFFMTSDGKWNSNNPLGSRFDQIKPSCRLLPVHRDDDFSLFENDFPKIVANIHAIENLGNPRKSHDTHSIIIDEPGRPPQIKLLHHLFTVCCFSLFRSRH